MDAPTDQAIRVLIADDHGLIRRGTREILNECGGFEVVGEAVDGVDAVAKAGSLKPDVLLLDVGMPGLNGVEAARAIKAAEPDIAILMLSVHSDIEYVWEAIRAGASGYVLKDVQDTALCDAVKKVGKGGSVLDEELTGHVLTRLRSMQSEDEDPAPKLTSRELETLEAAAGGLSNAEIAHRLEVSHRTVEVHLGNLFKKLGVRNRTEAVIEALKAGLIEQREA